MSARVKGLLLGLLVITFYVTAAMQFGADTIISASGVIAAEFSAVVFYMTAARDLEKTDHKL